MRSRALKLRALIPSCRNRMYYASFLLNLKNQNRFHLYKQRLPGLLGKQAKTELTNLTEKGTKQTATNFLTLKAENRETKPRTESGGGTVKATN
ncbi:hypothetical protein TanjilG_12892 [Lupinus angustifolius]|uniref:Uncharacterized protein n=1 Tax=Lupinus angustifolius TaxID=3871 RepID=A0A1J7H4U8_LUPAN|nr:hypothetical protein TanjilG_12892 [Lupinus angustifolius]